MCFSPLPILFFLLRFIPNRTPYFPSPFPPGSTLPFPVDLGLDPLHTFFRPPDFSSMCGGPFPHWYSHSVLPISCQLTVGSQLTSLAFPLYVPRLSFRWQWRNFFFFGGDPFPKMFDWLLSFYHVFLRFLDNGNDCFFLCLGSLNPPPEEKFYFFSPRLTDVCSFPHSCESKLPRFPFFPCRPPMSLDIAYVPQPHLAFGFLFLATVNPSALQEPTLPPWPGREALFLEPLYWLGPRLLPLSFFRSSFLTERLKSSSPKYAPPPFLLFG